MWNAGQGCLAGTSGITASALMRASIRLAAAWQETTSAARKMASATKIADSDRIDG